MGEKSLKDLLQEAADAPGVRSALFVNRWGVTAGDEEEAVLRAAPGHEIAPEYRRADGKPRLKGQRGDQTATQARREAGTGR